MRAQDALGGPRSALVVANPVPEEEQLDPALHARVLADALHACEAEGVTGQSVTPFLLERLVRLTDGASLSANLAAVWGTCGCGPDRRGLDRARDGAGRCAAGRRGRGHGRRRLGTGTAGRRYGHRRHGPAAARRGGC